MAPKQAEQPQTVLNTASNYKERRSEFIQRETTQNTGYYPENDGFTNFDPSDGNKMFSSITAGSSHSKYGAYSDLSARKTSPQQRLNTSPPPNPSLSPLQNIKLSSRSKSFSYGQKITHPTPHSGQRKISNPETKHSQKSSRQASFMVHRAGDHPQGSLNPSHVPANSNHVHPNSNHVHASPNHVHVGPAQRSPQNKAPRNNYTAVSRSHTTANREMLRYELAIDLKNYGSGSQTAAGMSTFQQQEQYRKNATITFNTQNLVFYGPATRNSLVYAGQNPAFKNYLRLRRLKHEESVFQKVAAKTSLVDDSASAADGFIKVNIKGNRRLDNPEEYVNLHLRRSENEAAEKSGPKAAPDKSTSGFKKVFKLFRGMSTSEDKKKPEQGEGLRGGGQKSMETSGNYGSSAQNSVKTGEKHGNYVENGLQTGEKHGNYAENRLKTIEKHEKYTKNTLQTADNHEGRLKTAENYENYTKKTPKTADNITNPSRLSVASSDKGLDMLLDTVLSSYEDDSDPVWSREGTLSPPAMPYISPLAILNDSIGMSRRCSVSSLNSVHSSSRNSLKSLSFTNLQKLRLLQSDGENERDEILGRLFDSFQTVKIFDENSKKWTVYKGKARDSRAGSTENMAKKAQPGIVFSTNVQVFQLPESDISEESDFSEEEEEEDISSGLSEDQLMQLRNRKELELFHEIKREINDFKSFEMLVHKDSVLNTHFFT